MLREIVRKAVVETEDYWLKLAKELDCDQIQKLGARVSNRTEPDEVHFVQADSEILS